MKKKPKSSKLRLCKYLRCNPDEEDPVGRESAEAPRIDGRVHHVEYVASRAMLCLEHLSLPGALAMELREMQNHGEG